MAAMDDLVQRLKRGDLYGAVEVLARHALGSTRVIHIDTVTPTDATPQVGQGPTPVVLGGASGALMALHFDTTTDLAYRLIKIPSNYVGDASFHIHWTKGVNTNQAGATVRWRITYKVFNGASEEVTSGSQVLEFDDTYDDSGTTTRVVYRTANGVATGFLPGYYVAVKLEYVPASTTLSGGPVCVSADCLLRVTVNSDS